MTAEREGLADLLAEHDYRWSSVGAICLCGHVPEVDASTLWTQQDYHRHHLADLLAARDRRVRGEVAVCEQEHGQPRADLRPLRLAAHMHPPQGHR